ncbi:hypothetical protein OEZ86_007446 [Tetradesmus obliquus]|nr:hypothetical protein OEZ86_007446 [Tetradesmus obliquus]
MCTSLFIYDIHPALLLLLTFNRDEFFDRPTQPAHFWPDEPVVLAGRDALRKGTWLGLTKHGRFSLLTNYREPINAADPGKFEQTTAAPSRGALTTDFLTGSSSPLEYLQALPHQDYFGFNLLAGDLQQQQLAYVSNRGPSEPQLLPPGCYGISNGLLQQWPKELPLTGVGEETDRKLSSIFVEPFDMQPGVQYGTRSQTIIAVWRDGRVEQRERYIEKEEGHGQGGKHKWVWKEAKHSFHMMPALQQQQQQQDAGLCTA